jgi:hypothetical protein
VKYVRVERTKQSYNGGDNYYQVGEVWIYTTQSGNKPLLPPPRGNTAISSSAFAGVCCNSLVTMPVDNVIYADACCGSLCVAPPWAAATEFSAYSRPTGAIGYHSSNTSTAFRWWRATLPQPVEVVRVEVFCRPEVADGPVASGAEDGRRLDDFTVTLLDVNSQVVWQKAWDGGAAWPGTWMQAYPGKAMGCGRAMTFDVNTSTSFARDAYTAPPFSGGF